MIATLLSGILWRRYGSRFAHRLLRKMDISWSDETPNAWSSITQHNSTYRYSQIAVQLTDQTWLYCNDASRFANAPFGPCVLGPNGDLALYVTDKCDPGGEICAIVDTIDPHYGDEITYVPAAQVKAVRLRLWQSKKNSHSISKGDENTSEQ